MERCEVGYSYAAGMLAAAKSTILLLTLSGPRNTEI